MAPSFGSLRSASRRVPGLPRSGFSERGKSSYHVLKRAFGRLAKTLSTGSNVTASSRSSRAAMMSRTGSFERSSTASSGRIEPPSLATTSSSAPRSAPDARTAALSKIDLDVTPGLHLRFERRLPRREAVGPRLDREEVEPDLVERELAPISIVVEEAHRRLDESILALLLPAHD